jgi:hypothetical protein
VHFLPLCRRLSLQPLAGQGHDPPDSMSMSPPRMYLVASLAVSLNAGYRSPKLGIRPPQLRSPRIDREGQVGADNLFRGARFLYLSSAEDAETNLLAASRPMFRYWPGDPLRRQNRHERRHVAAGQALNLGRVYRLWQHPKCGAAALGTFRLHGPLSFRHSVAAARKTTTHRLPRQDLPLSGCRSQ